MKPLGEPQNQYNQSSGSAALMPCDPQEPQGSEKPGTLHGRQAASTTS